MAGNVGKRMNRIKWILETSLLKTLARKHGIRVTKVLHEYQTIHLDRKILRVTVERPNKEPLAATFGGIPFKRIPGGTGAREFQTEQAWSKPGDRRSEVVQRLMAGRCELCGDKDVPVEVHHIRKLADIDRLGRRPKAPWERVMSARQRKTLVVCEECHDAIHAGRYDGPKL
jgi:hypothetical protein